MGWRTYYWQWLKRSVWRAPNVTEKIVGYAALAVAVVVGLYPKFGTPVNAGWWQVIVWTFVLVMGSRFILVPYWMAREQAAAVAVSEAARTQAEAALAVALTPKVTAQNPEGIYQDGRLVGQVRVPRNHGGGQWSFERVDDAVDFNLGLPFEYQGIRLQHIGHQVDGHVTIGGAPIRSLHGVTARTVE